MKDKIILALSLILIFGFGSSRLDESLLQNNKADLNSAAYFDLCVGHGGVDCTVVKSDASVTCKDGTIDETFPFIWAVPQCKADLEAMTQQQAQFMTASGCSPPSEIGCMSGVSYNNLLAKLKVVGLQNSELGINELNECAAQIKQFQFWDQDYKSCLAENHKTDFHLPGNELILPILKVAFCPIFYGGHASYDDATSLCLCDTGYFLSNGACVEATQLCKQRHGSNAYAKNGQCLLTQTVPAPHTSASPVKTGVVTPTITPTKLPGTTLLYVPTPSNNPGPYGEQAQESISLRTILSLVLKSVKDVFTLW